jgi:hypothetical protein
MYFAIESVAIPSDTIAARQNALKKEKRRDMVLSRCGSAMKMEGNEVKNIAMNNHVCIISSPVELLLTVLYRHVLLPHCRELEMTSFHGKFILKLYPQMGRPIFKLACVKILALLTNHSAEQPDPFCILSALRQALVALLQPIDWVRCVDSLHL